MACVISWKCWVAPTPLRSTSTQMPQRTTVLVWLSWKVAPTWEPATSRLEPPWTTGHVTTSLVPDVSCRVHATSIRWPSSPTTTCANTQSSTTTAMATACWTGTAMACAINLKLWGVRTNSLATTVPRRLILVSAATPSPTSTATETLCAQFSRRSRQMRMWTRATCQAPTRRWWKPCTPPSRQPSKPHTTTTTATRPTWTS